MNYYDPQNIIPNNAIEDGIVDVEDILIFNQPTTFHLQEIGATYTCKICGNSNFNVGVGNYRVAIKCHTCLWEIYIQ